LIFEKDFYKKEASMTADQVALIEAKFAALPDRRSEAGDYKVLPNEKAVNVEDTPQPKKKKPLDRKAELARMFRVKDVNEIGTNGPAVAAVAAEGSEKDAGQGLFEGRFTRDNMLGAFLLLESHPKALMAAIMGHVEKMGVKDDPDTLEAPGKWFHEDWDMSHPQAQKLLKETGWKEFPTYMACDTTLLAIIGICKQFEISGYRFLEQMYTGKDNEKRTMFYALFESLGWLERELDKNPEGLLMYFMTNPKAHLNPTMPDSHDSMFDKAGRLPNFKLGVATSHDQGFAYDALVRAAKVLHEIGKDLVARQLERRAEELRESFLKHFWTEDSRGGFFPAGVHRQPDGSLAQLDVLKGTSFLVLNSRILDPNEPLMAERIEKAIRTMFSPELLAAGGLRSCATSEIRFREGAYHNGNVWLWINVWVAMGLRKLGYHALALVLEERTMHVVEQTGMPVEFCAGNIGNEIILNDQIVEVVNLDDWKVLAELGVASVDKPWINRVKQPAQHVQYWSLAGIDRIETYWERHGMVPQEQNYQFKRIESEIVDRLPLHL
jgi:hypothetical protein